MRLNAALAPLLGLVFMSVQASAQPVDWYTPSSPLADPPPNAAAYGTHDVNEQGSMCGFIRLPGAFEPYIFVDGTVYQFPNIFQPSSFTVCVDINDHNEAIIRRFGSFSTVATQSFLVRQDNTGAWIETQIPSFTGGGNVFATAINNAGQVVGYVQDGSDGGMFIYDELSGATHIPVGPNNSARAYDINELGEIAGDYSFSPNTGGSQIQPFIYSDGTTTLVDVSVCPSSSIGARISGINDVGDMVGTCDIANSTRTPFVIVDGVQQIVRNVEDIMLHINNDKIAVGMEWIEHAGGSRSFLPYVWDALNGSRTLQDLIVPDVLPEPLVSSNAGFNEAGQIATGPFLHTPETNVAPRLDAVADQMTLENNQLTFVLTASDLDGNNLTFSGRNASMGAVDDSLLALGATLDPVSGLFDWTPGFDRSGNYELEFAVMDDGDPARLDMQTVTVTVGNINRPPILDDIAPADVLVGEELVVEFSASDPDGDIVDVWVTNLPAGASLTEDQLTLYWVPTLDQVGVHTLEVTATDRGDPPLTAIVYLTVTVGNIYAPGELIDLIETTILEAEFAAKLEKKLLAHIQKIEKHFNKGKVDNAINEAQKLIADIQQAINVGSLDSATGGELIGLVEQLISMLSEGPPQ